MIHSHVSINAVKLTTIPLYWVYRLVIYDDAGNIIPLLSNSAKSICYA